MLYSLSNLDADKLEAIKSLENEIGSPLIALSGVKIGDVPLSADKLRLVQAAEKKLGVVLLAVDAH